MAYGLNIQDVEKNRKRAELKATDLGHSALVVDEPEFGLVKMHAEKGKNGLWHDTNRHGFFYIEEGRVIVRINAGGKKFEIPLGKGEVLKMERGIRYKLQAEDESTLYVFLGKYEYHKPQDELDLSCSDPVVSLSCSDPVVSKTHDFRDKYWGTIETIVSNHEIAGKRIFLDAKKWKGKWGSLEYHLRKKEAYYVHSGIVQAGVRVGRAENYTIKLSQGESFVIPQGLMHRRGSFENAVIIEISTKDDDSDSNLVANGEKDVCQI